MVFDKKLNTKRTSKIQSEDPYKAIKDLVFIYFYLLIFEGALRKWFLPFLATPLLLVRDPVVILAMIRSVKKGIFPSNGYILVSSLIGIVSIITAILAGHGNLLVALYGARPFLIYFPFIFIIGKVFTEKDVIRLGKITLWISLLMTVIITLQFHSPQSAWINQGVGGDEAGAGFGGALGYFRPPGTFSFTNGTTLFYGFLSVFVFFFWLNQQYVPKPLLILSTIGLIVAIPFSLSRTLMFSVIVVGMFVVFYMVKKPQNIVKILTGMIMLIFILLVVSQISLFKPAIDAFMARFDTANEQEGGLQGTLGDRYLGGMLKAFSFSSNISFWGVGSGLYSNVGTQLTAGHITAAVSEGEWGRLIAELGPLMGLSVILMRVILSLEQLIKCYKKMVINDLLPWILLGFALQQGAQSNWTQATSLGFSILITGLVYSALQNKSTTILSQNLL